jgi:hypothetical protein
MKAKKWNNLILNFERISLWEKSSDVNSVEKFPSKKFHLHFSFSPPFLSLSSQFDMKYFIFSLVSPPKIFSLNRRRVSKFQCFNISVNVARFFAFPPNPQKDIIFVNFHFYFITFSFELFQASLSLYPRTVVRMNNKLCFYGAHMSQQNQVSL